MCIRKWQITIQEQQTRNTPVLILGFIYSMYNPGSVLSGEGHFPHNVLETGIRMPSQIGSVTQPCQIIISAELAPAGEGGGGHNMVTCSQQKVWDPSWARKEWASST